MADSAVCDDDSVGRRQPVTLELTADEALVLFEWLSRSSPSDQPAPYADRAEQIALWNLECLLERVLVEPFDPDYDALVQAARTALRGEG
jgi:hypothetical protein